MSEFHFLRPWWFTALLPLLVLLWLLWHRRLHSRSWQDICDPELLPHLLIGKSTRRANWPLAFMLVASLLAILALAGPTWQKQPQPVLRQQSALIIALDVSRSMLAADLKPNRLVRARLKVEDILRQRREGQTALIAFTADAFTVTPLTDDTRTIQALLSSLDPGMMPVQGSRPAKAFELAGQLLKQAGLAKGKLLLLTDEDRPQLSVAAAAQLSEQGLELEIIGVGTVEGAPIPVVEGGFFKDSQGNMVLPQLNESGLRELAAAGGGAYRRLAIDDSDFKSLLADLTNRRLDQAEKGAERTGDLWQDAGVWLVWPLVLLALCGFRRGWLLVVPLLLPMLLTPPSAQALEWHELWQNSQQQAYEKYQQGAYQDAAQQFADPRWQSGSHYLAGDYEAALGAAPQPETADDWYNRGNMLAQNGKLQDALKAYDEALKRDPEAADAKANRDLVEQALQQQNQQQNEQGQNSDQQEHQQGNDQNKQQSQSDDRDQQQSSDQGQQQQADQQDQKQTDNQQQDSSQAADEQQNAEQTSQQDKPQQQQQAQQAGNEQQDQAAPAADQQQQDTEKQGQQEAMADDSDSQQPEDPELQQWLRRIPDDPGGLLRRKFQYQYRQMYQQGGQEDERSW